MEKTKVIGLSVSLGMIVSIFLYATLFGTGEVSDFDFGLYCFLLIASTFSLYMLLTKYFERWERKERERKRKKRQQNSGSPAYGKHDINGSAPTNKKMYVLQLLAFMVNADNDEKYSETATAEYIMKGLYADREDLADARLIFNEELESTRHISGIKTEDEARKAVAYTCRQITESFTRASCEQILMHIMSVAYSDNFLSDTERLLLKTIAKCFGISKNDYSEILHKFMDRKYGSGYYDNSREGKEEKQKKEQEQRQDNNRQQEQRRTNTHSSYMEREYATLGLTPNATDEEVRKAWRTLLGKYHPDLYETQGEEAVRQATEKAQQINEAYQKICRARGL